MRFRTRIDLRQIATLAIVCASALAASCAKAPVIPPPPAPVNVVIDVAASSDVNPDTTGRASPVTVRVYALNDDAAFAKADFFVLWDREAEALGASSIARHEFPLAPSGTAQATFKLDPATRAFGVVAAFRDFRAATWRATAAVPPAPAPGSTLTLKVLAASHAVTAGWK
jgi:type VI secretion system protein VasD